MSLHDDLSAVLALIEKADEARRMDRMYSTTLVERHDCAVAIHDADVTAREFFRTHAPALAEMARERDALRERVSALENALQAEFVSAESARIAAAEANARRYMTLLQRGLEISWNRMVSYSPGYVDGDAEELSSALDALAHQPGGGEKT